MDDSSQTRRPTLTRRLVTRFALTIVAALTVLAIVLDRALQSASLDPSRLARMRVLIFGGTALAALISVVVVAVFVNCIY